MILTPGQLGLELGHVVLDGDDGGGHERGQAEQVGVDLLALLDELLHLHVAAQVVHLEAGDLEHHLDQVLADVVDVALHGADDDHALAFDAVRRSGHQRLQDAQARRTGPRRRPSARARSTPPASYRRPISAMPAARPSMMAFCGSMPAATASLATLRGRLLVAVHDRLLELRRGSSLRLPCQSPCPAPSLVLRLSTDRTRGRP